MVRRRSQLLKGAREFLLHFQMPIAFAMLGSGRYATSVGFWGDDAAAVSSFMLCLISPSSSYFTGFVLLFEDLHRLEFYRFILHPVRRQSGQICSAPEDLFSIFWNVEQLLGTDREISNYRTAVTSNGFANKYVSTTTREYTIMEAVFCMWCVLGCCKQGQLTVWVKRQTRPLVRESAPRQQTCNCLTVIKIWS
jgi:hypothetical protein